MERVGTPQAVTLKGGDKLSWEPYGYSYISEAWGCSNCSDWALMLNLFTDFGSADDGAYFAIQSACGDYEGLSVPSIPWINLTVFTKDSSLCDQMLECKQFTQRFPADCGPEARCRLYLQDTGNLTVFMSDITWVAWLPQNVVAYDGMKSLDAWSSTKDEDNANVNTSCGLYNVHIYRYIHTQFELVHIDSNGESL